MISQDDLVQQLLELDAEIAAAMQRKRVNEQETYRWSSGRWDDESGALSGDTATVASASIQRLQEQREVLVRQIEMLPDFD